MRDLKLNGNALNATLKTWHQIKIVKFAAQRDQKIKLQHNRFQHKL